MTATPLLDRIQARREDRRVVDQPTPITERMSPFLRRLRDRQLAVKDFTRGSYVPDGSGDAA